MLAVLHDPFQHRPKLRSAHGFLVPFRQNYRGNLDVLAQFLSRMAAEKEALEKGRLALRVFKFLQRVFDRVCQRRHNGKSQFTDFNAAVKSPRREIANKYLSAFHHWTTHVERKLLPSECLTSNRSVESAGQIATGARRESPKPTFQQAQQNQYLICQNRTVL